MGLAGVRNADNMAMFEAKKPLVVAYYNVDYAHNPKGSNYWRNRCAHKMHILVQLQPLIFMKT